MNNTEKIILLIEAVLKNKLSAKDALENWPTDIYKEQDKMIQKIWHELHHFSVDEDIRARDTDYDKYQRDLLASFITELRNKIRQA